MKVNLTVATSKGKGIEAEVALAVVDEAVLALTGYKTPTLTKLTRFDLPLEVFTGELLTLLVHQTPFYPSKVEPLTGGGGFQQGVIGHGDRVGAGGSTGGHADLGHGGP